jgi:hemoglobin-like flavoprotein
MNKQTVTLLKSSFAKIAKQRPDVAALFYKRLFEVAPAVKPMFKSSPKDQQRKLTAALAQIVASLEQPEKLAAHLTRMGERHVAYGAQPAHYKVVGEVLLWTFGQVLKQDFTTEVRAAWVAAYAAVSKAMIAAAKAAEPKAAPAAKPKLKVVARKPAAQRVQRTTRSAAEGGKRKAARRPVRKPARQAKTRTR